MEFDNYEVAACQVDKHTSRDSLDTHQCDAINRLAYHEPQDHADWCRQYEHNEEYYGRRV